MKMAPNPTSQQQGFIGTVVSPSLGSATALLSIHLHESCGLKYIPVASICALYPNLIRLEVDGETITPTVGFQCRKRLAVLEAETRVSEVASDAEAYSTSSEDSTERYDTTEETSLGEFLHALVNVDESLGLERRTTEKESLHEQHSDSNVLLQESAAQVYSIVQTVATQKEHATKSEIIPPTSGENNEIVTPCSEDDVEWIEYQPGKIIHVVHDLAALSSTFPPEAEYPKIAIVSSSTTAPTLTEQQQKPLLQNPATVELPSLISSSASELPESYWLRFRQEMEDVVLKFLIPRDPSAVPEDHHREAFEEAMALSINRQVERVTRRPAMPSPLSRSISRDPSTSPSSEDDTQDDGVAQSMSPESEDLSKSDCASSSSDVQSSDNSSSGSSSPEHDVSDGSSSGSISTKRTRSPPPLRASYHPLEDRKRYREDRDRYSVKSDHAFTPLNNRQREQDVLVKNEPFKFSEIGLARFVDDQKGIIHNLRTQAITVTLDSWPIAQRFYMFLYSKQYRGTWLDVSLTWNWRHVDMENFVRAIENTKIQTLFLNGYESQQHRSTTNSRCDSLVRLLGHKSLKELRLVDMPDILRLSNVPLPADLSHLEVLEISCRPVDENGQQNGRVFELMKSTSHLRRLVLDAPPAGLQYYMTHIQRAIEASKPTRVPLAETEHSMKKPPSVLDVQFYQNGKSWVTLQIERASADIRECSLDFSGALRKSYSSSSKSGTYGSSRSVMNTWSYFFCSDLSHSLTTLRIKNQPDDSWIPPLLEWIKAHRQSKRALILELRVDCQSISKSRFKDFCGLIAEAGSTVTELRLTNMESLTRADWILFFKSLDFSVLKALHVERTNLGDREVRELIGCLKNVSRRDGSLNLSKLTLLKTIVSSIGWKELQNECAKNRWRISVVST
ncbi:hypothetical protein BGZ68_005183 [Mortierella alpina]|nr:hypothetical protein BGZ68_005183 [Mortierella alpina]